MICRPMKCVRRHAQRVSVPPQFHVICMLNDQEAQGCTAEHELFTTQLI